VAEILPFRGLHYANADLSALVCPPFDVISPEEQRRLYERSPFNAVRLEYGETRPDDTPSHNRYTRAAATLRDWLQSGVLVRDDAPAFYVDDQRFSHEGRLLMRRSLFARVRLHGWDEGPIRPHERTLDRPKEDRIQLLRACRLNISPILSLYRDGAAAVRDAVESAIRAAPLLATAEANGERHSLRRLSDDAALELIASLLRDETFYVIDGHHRYETALAYRNERRSQAQAWTGDEPENFVLMALIAREDPGVVVLPTHRLLKNVAVPEDFVTQLERDFTVEDVSASVRDGGWRAMQSGLSKGAERDVAFGLAMRDGRRLVLRVRDAGDIAQRMPAGCPASWRTLDAAILEAVVLRGILGIDQQGAAADGSLTFTHDGEEALRLVDSGDCAIAFLLSPAPVEQVLSMADAGERMPQKSTYFYPKLPAGLVMNLLY
jgi:uncharacterized protein (DUF1015 family)